jgi:hypothetical protein
LKVRVSAEFPRWSVFVSGSRAIRKFAANGADRYPTNPLASLLADLTRIPREMNHRDCKERRRSLLPMRVRLPKQSFRPSRFAFANRITSVLPTIRAESSNPVRFVFPVSVSPASLGAVSTMQTCRTLSRCKHQPRLTFGTQASLRK